MVRPTSNDEAAAALREPVRVVYVVGAGRSGSTILGILLGHHTEIENLGEVNRWAAHDGLPRDPELNERSRFFWSQVRDSLPAGFPSGGLSLLRQQQEAMERRSRFPAHLLSLVSAAERQRYEASQTEIFRAASRVSQKTWMLDTSKNACRAIRLLRAPGADVRVVHLIRDPRGVVCSFRRQGVEQAPKSLVAAVFGYVLANGAALLVRVAAGRRRSLSVRYEDLACDPNLVASGDAGPALERLGQLLELDISGLQRLVDEKVPLQAGPVIDGNRIRRHEEQVFRVDVSWKKDLGRVTRAICLLMTLPLSLGFGYLGARESDPGA